MESGNFAFLTIGTSLAVITAFFKITRVWLLEIRTVKPANRFYPAFPLHRTREMRHSWDSPIEQHSVLLCGPKTCSNFWLQLDSPWPAPSPIDSWMAFKPVCLYVWVCCQHFGSVEWMNHFLHFLYSSFNFTKYYYQYLLLHSVRQVFIEQVCLFRNFQLLSNFKAMGFYHLSANGRKGSRIRQSIFNSYTEARGTFKNILNFRHLITYSTFFFIGYPSDGSEKIERTALIIFFRTYKINNDDNKIKARTSSR